MAEQRVSIRNTEQRVQQPAVAQIDFRALHQPLGQIRAVGLQAANQIGPFEVVEIFVDRVIAETEALTEPRGIPNLPVNGSEHGQESLSLLRASREAPGG